jgi:FimV-like protein
LSRQQHVETVAVLARTYIEQGLFLEALQTLEEAGRLQLSQSETIELLLLRVQVLRSIGLTDKAIALLGEKGQFLPSPELKGKAALELARCYTEAGDPESARKTLSEAFGLVEPGPLAQQVGCELARTCLRLGEAGQAISVCSRMLEHAAPAAREPIMDLLADGYRAQAKYDRAVAVLLDRYDTTADANTTRN